MVKILRVLRVLRPLRAINRAKGLKVKPHHKAVLLLYHIKNYNLRLVCAEKTPQLINVYVSVFTARGAVCVRGHPNYR